MYDYTFDLRALDRELTKGDFDADPRLLTDSYRSAKVASAQLQASTGLSGFSIRSTNLRGKPVYQVLLIEHSLILRKFTRNKNQ